MDVPKPNNRVQYYKYASLIGLTIQGALAALSMRYGRTRADKEQIFFSSTSVILTELIKLSVCLAIVFVFEVKGSVKGLFGILYKRIVQHKMDTLKICVPSLLYIIQNNLAFVAASNIDAATYQISLQFSIITTAVFAVLILQRKLLHTQWAALYFLLAGIFLIELTDLRMKPDVGSPNQNRLLGMGAAFGMAVLSGLAGVLLEKSLKRDDVSVWMRNVQMSLVGVPLGIGTCLVTDLVNIQSKGFFHGYDWFVVYLAFCNAISGLLVGLVFRYADSILKGFATSGSIILICIASMFLFGVDLTIQFGIGVMIVIGSIYLYGHVPRPLEIDVADKCLDQKDIERAPEQTEDYVNEQNGIYVIRL